MQKLFFATLLLVSALAFFQCKNNFSTADEWPAPTPPKSIDAELAPGGYVLFDLKKNFTTNGKATFSIENAADLQGKFTITTDGYLVYQAPKLETNEKIQLRIDDAAASDDLFGAINLTVKSQPTGTGSCFVANVATLDLMVVGTNPAERLVADFIQNDTACGYVPTGDFELVFPPFELQTELLGDKIRVLPSPGGIGIDAFVYKGSYVGIDSAYLAVVLVTNQTGCFNWAVDDQFTRTFSPSAMGYEIDILANDAICGLPRDSITVSVDYLNQNGGLKHGTLEVLPNKNLFYRLNPGATLPVEELFTPYVQFRNVWGGSSANSFNVFLKIKN